MLVDLKGFKSLVDAVGGLDIAVQRRTPIGSQYEIKGWIKAGNQHLDGYQALWYARSRANSTNYERMARQRCVVTAMVRQLDPQTIVLHFSDIAKATKGVFRTDIPQEALASLATLAVKTKTQKITSVNFVPPLIKPWSYDPQVVRDTVAGTIAAAEQADERAAAEPAASRGHRRRARAKASQAQEAGRHGPPGHRPGRQHLGPGERLLGELSAARRARHPTRRMWVGPPSFAILTLRARTATGPGRSAVCSSRTDSGAPTDGS